MQPSPYTPGETAREVPGRETQLTDITGLLGRVALEHRFAGQVRVDVGPRGVGKTSLLRRAQRTRSGPRRTDRHPTARSRSHPRIP